MLPSFILRQQGFDWYFWLVSEDDLRFTVENEVLWGNQMRITPESIDTGTRRIKWRLRL